jgi:sulfite exporter TauE/SafE
VNGEFLLPAAFAAGFFGSTHCIGMCGAIVVLFEQQVAGSLVRRLAYNAGRLGFYALLGAIAGAGGAVLTRIGGMNYGLMILRLIAGLLVIAIGLHLVFNGSPTRFLESAGAVIWQKLSPLARHVLPMSTSTRALGAGFLWGALPCGLVYSSVAMAATSGSAPGGATVMLAFWAGTLPALLVAGAGAGQLNRLRTNVVIRRIAGLAVITVGLFALVPVVKTFSAGI